MTMVIIVMPVVAVVVATMLLLMLRPWVPPFQSKLHPCLHAYMGVHKQLLPIFLPFAAVKLCKRREMTFRRFREFKLLCLRLIVSDFSGVRGL